MFKNLNTKILSAFFLLLCLMIIFASFTIPPLNKFAEALSANYNTGKTELAASDWLRLPFDFLALTGDRPMEGNLNMAGNSITNSGGINIGTGGINMNGHTISNLGPASANNDAVTLGVMNTAITNTITGASGVTNEGGTNWRMVCGSRALSLANTFQHEYVSGAVDALRIVFSDLNTGFSAASTPRPFYFVSISGNGNMYKTTGGNTVYNPTPAGFTMYLKYFDPLAVPVNYISPSSVVGWGWVVNWCAVGI